MKMYNIASEMVPKSGSFSGSQLFLKTSLFYRHFKRILITVDSNTKDFIANDYYFTYLVI
jgi:hypothetical protein